MHVVLSQTTGIPSRPFSHVIYVIKQVALTSQWTNVSTNMQVWIFTPYRLTVIYDRNTNKYYHRSARIIGFQEGLSKTEMVNSVFSYSYSTTVWKLNWMSLYCLCVFAYIKKCCSSPAYCGALKHTINQNKLNQYKHSTHSLATTLYIYKQKVHLMSLVKL